ncbi:MAG: hypothetical protein ABI347_01090 [Nitrososphaera sp.]
MNTGLLEAIGNLRPDIESVSIISSGKVSQNWSRAAAAAANPHPPSNEDMRRMLLQVDVFTSMPSMNEKLYGKVEFLLISHEIYMLF